MLVARNIQAKLTVNAPNDQYEQEADAVAKQVVSTINTSKSPANTLDRALNTRAFTSQSDPFFRDGDEYNNSAGKELLAHEPAYTIQQGASAQKKTTSAWQRRR